MLVVPMWMAEVLGSVVLVAIAASIYVKTRDRFMFHWLIGWGLALLAGSPMAMEEPTTLFVVMYEVARVVGVHYLLKGNSEFHGRKMPRIYDFLTAVTLAFVLIGLPALRARVSVEQTPYLLLPSIALHAVYFVASGRMFWQAPDSRPLARYLASWGYGLLGVHMLDYPVLHSLPGVDKWAYMIGFLLGLAAALGSFLFYFDRRDLQSRRETEAKEQAQAALIASEARYRELADLLPETVFEIDLEGNLTFGNRAGFQNFGFSYEDMTRGLNVFRMIVPEEMEVARENLQRAALGEARSQNEYTAVRKDGTRFPVIIRGNPIVHDGVLAGLRGIIVDITDIKSAQDQLSYLSLHDPLTGLFNRTYFEQVLHRSGTASPCGVGIVVCDMDGLKLVNDTLGHQTGDRLLSVAAEVVTKTCRPEDVIARVGGDEFAVLMPDLGPEPKATIEEACLRLQELAKDYNEKHPELPLSISTGYAISNGVADLNQLFREADDHMYREKLHRSQSARNSIVQTMMKTLEARDYATEHHAERLEKLVTAVAQALDFPSQRLADLRLLAQFHDIGKVGVSDSILFKHGPLSPKQREEINRHSEIGYRIAQAAPDLSPIADAILKHHEWWDGNGYPLGLKGEEIPLECRILAIADAFDAMTSERPYRRKLALEQAIEELIRCSGTQFDPHLVEVFVRVVGSHAENVAT